MLDPYRLLGLRFQHCLVVYGLSGFVFVLFFISGRFFFVLFVIDFANDFVLVFGSTFSYFVISIISFGFVGIFRIVNFGVILEKSYADKFHY